MRVAFALVLASCGYSMQQAESMPGGYHKVYVPQALDASFDTGPALIMTRVFRSLIQGSTVAEHVAKAKDAEVVAELKLENTSDAAGVSGQATPNQTYTVSQFVLTLTGSLRLYDAAGKIVWQALNVPVTEYYLAGPSADALVPKGSNPQMLQQTENNRRRALDRGAEELSRELYKRMMESF